MTSLSVLIPVFNGRKVLRQALENILRQTLLPDEIAVHDDGSTDGLSNDASSHAALCSAAGVRFSFSRTETNRGRGAARQLLLERAIGPLVAWYDADDLWHRGKLELQVSAYERLRGDFDPRRFILVCDYIRSNGRNIARRSHVRLPPRLGVPELLATNGPARNIQLQTTLGHQDAFLAAGGFDDALNWAEDFDFALRFADTGGLFLNGTDQDCALVCYFQSLKSTSMALVREANLRIVGKLERVFHSHSVHPDAFYQSKLDRYIRHCAAAEAESEADGAQSTELLDEDAELRRKFTLSNHGKLLVAGTEEDGSLNFGLSMPGPSPARFRTLWLDEQESLISETTSEHGQAQRIPQSCFPAAYLNGASLLRIQCRLEHSSAHRFLRLHRQRSGLVVVAPRFQQHRNSGT